MTIPSTFHLLILLSTTLSMADNSNPAVFLTLCGRNQTKNPRYLEANYHTALKILSLNMNQTGFGTSYYGNTYILGQCFNYMSPLDCQICYGEGTVKLPQCLPASDSRIYLDGCFLRYADHAIFNAAVDSSDTTRCSNATSGVSNSTIFRENVIGLMTNLTLGAEKDSGYYSVGSSTVAEPGVTVYGMAQCWRSLYASGCRSCLESARETLVRCLPASDGKAMNAGCFLRYSTLPFYLASTTTDGTKGRSHLGAILGSVLAVLVAMTAAILWKRRKFAINVTRQGLEGSEDVMRSITTSNLIFKYEDLRKATNDFNQINKLGQGGYGSVYKGILSDGSEIAVKRLFFNTKQRADQFFNEVTLISQVQHKNLVKLLGCSIVGPESLLVYEYLCNTSLEKFLFDPIKKYALDWGKRCDIIIGTAEGLAYLHSSSEIRIIHRDIKASNILLDERFRPKIADFGLARSFGDDKSHLSTGLAGTFGYMAPEYIIHGHLTEKADIYSYGILVIEIMTGRKNQLLVSADGQSLMSMVWKHFNEKCLVELLDPLLQGKCSDEEALKFFRVGLLCTQASPILRPPMWKVVEMLSSNSTRDLPLPTQPPFISIRCTDINGKDSETSQLISSSSKSRVSENQMSVSTMQGR